MDIRRHGQLEHGERLERRRAGLVERRGDRYQGNPEVTASFGTVDSISIANSATPTSLTFINAGASTVAGDVTNSGELYVDRLSGDGGSTLAIDGMLTNNGGIDIGPADNSLSAASTVEAAGLANAGTIRLYGSSTAEATLDVASAAGTGAAGTLDGEIDLYGDALVEFASGEISTIQPGSLLYLWGPDAFVADASATSSNSALAGLTTNKGLLDLQDGASVTTSGGLSNRGAIELDYPWGQVGVGGSSLAIGGTLTNDGTIGSATRRPSTPRGSSTSSGRNRARSSSTAFPRRRRSTSPRRRASAPPVRFTAGSPFPATRESSSRAGKSKPSPAH